MRARAALLALAFALCAAPGLAQNGSVTAPKPPTKPTVTVPKPVKPDVPKPVIAAKPPAGRQLTASETAELGRLRKELKDTETEIAGLEAARLKRDQLKSTKDAIDQTTPGDVMALQQAMDRKAQLESMISNVERGG